MKNWISAFRLRTLPLATSGIILGGALADFRFPSIILLLILTTTLLQICSNLANDLGDFEKGADKNRKGEKRMVSEGLISPKAMKMAVGISAVLGLIAGSCAVWFSPADPLVKAGIFVLGICSIIAAITYTMGKISYGYRGLGDVFVVIFFGLVPVVTTKLLLGATFSYYDLLPALALGSLASSVLSVNNIRDLKQDKSTGKKTIAVRLGPEKARNYHACLISFPFLLVAGYFMHTEQFNILVALPLISLVLILPSALKVLNNDDEILLDAQLKFHALGATLFAILLSVAIHYA
ncbi:1,4-dihydroxy-2-naphthoate octaprenyltransferase [Luteibaculum oceani]|uniref:1,4-dihydroxy-2-naphthoate octaprenyltransferase n=1 Tax=Luteibaculum oceani TaxID=1294296 RepID=A0A5C6VAG8_9FLAO|nr:1,4-dihydroxy-2-naphthoate octaprenyltransferase [Luteibaculum oceani]TXC81511.1 1,4-dihydroxy-2-naphthoate octaprenyltransferase [Luteibaculum oceani]